MTTKELLAEVEARGHFLLNFHGELAICPALPAPDPALYGDLCRRRHELITLLDTATKHLSKQAMLSEWDAGADQDALDRVLFILRSAPHHRCLTAACHLARRNTLGA